MKKCCVEGRQRGRDGRIIQRIIEWLSLIRLGRDKNPTVRVDIWSESGEWMGPLQEFTHLVIFWSVWVWTVCVAKNVNGPQSDHVVSCKAVRVACKTELSKMRSCLTFLNAFSLLFFLNFCQCYVFVTWCQTLITIQMKLLTAPSQGWRCLS